MPRQWFARLPGELEHAPLSATVDRDDHAVVAARSYFVLDLESPASTQPFDQGRQRSDPCPTLDTGLGSKLHRLRHAIKVDNPWISILRCSIGLSATDPRLFHVAMVGRGCLAHAPLEGGEQPRRLWRQCQVCPGSHAG